MPSLLAVIRTVGVSVVQSVDGVADRDARRSTTPSTSPIGVGGVGGGWRFGPVASATGTVGGAGGQQQMTGWA
jgi:hypothetical protein